MEWRDFVCQFRAVTLTRLGIPHRTVYAWRDGSKEPKGYSREALEFWIREKAQPSGAANPATRGG